MAELELLEEVPTIERVYASSKVDWYEVARVARENPTMWVKVPEVLSSGMFGNFRRGKIRGLSPDEFEMRTQSVDGNKHRRQLYVHAKG